MDVILDKSQTLIQSAVKVLVDNKYVILGVVAGAVIGARSMNNCSPRRMINSERGMKGSKFFHDPIKEYCYSHSNIKESEELSKLREATAAHPQGEMESTKDVGQLLVFLIRTIKAKNIIEVGSFTGVALLKMAQELPNDGKIFALDINNDFTSIGEPFIKEAGVQSKVEYRMAPAVESLLALQQEGYTNKVDLCFIDADKGNYPNYYRLCMDLLRPGGIIVFDNSLMKGRVVSMPTREPICRIHECNEKAVFDTRVTSLLLNVGDGTLILRKNDDEEESDKNNESQV